MIRFKPIFAKVPDFDYLYRTIEAEMRQEGPDTNAMFERFWQTWDGSPIAQFHIVTDRSRGTITLYNYPTGDQGILDIFEYTVFGTSPHPITPRGDYPLRFPSPDTFTPKTQPGVIQSVEGNRGGPGWVETYYVDHPGTRPRGTLAQINQERRSRVMLRLGMATRRGLQQSQRMGRVRK